MEAIVYEEFGGPEVLRHETGVPVPVPEPGTGEARVKVAAGVTVIGTASEPNHAYLTALGAIPVAYGDGLAARVRAAAPQGIDAVFDAAGHDTLPVSIELMGGAKDRIVMIAAPDAEEHGIVFSGVMESPATVRAGLTTHASLAASGALTIRLSETLPLKEAARAQELSESGCVRGKLILVP